MPKFNTKNLPAFFQNRTNVILAAILALILITGGVFGVRYLTQKVELPIEEVDLPFDPEGPYALLLPRNDGNSLLLNIFRVSSYESVSYELTYQATGSTADEGIGAVDRGVQGTFELKDKQSEYSQEILFGTCSQGYTSGAAHCVFDKGVENGTLTLRIKQAAKRGDKTQKVYKMITTWHLQKPDVSLGVITSTDSHFVYKSPASRQDLSVVGYSIVNDLSGVPKLPNGKKTLGKVYALNIPKAKTLPKGDVMLEISDNAPNDAKIGRYNESNNNWDILDTKVDGSKLSASADGSGIFAVLVSDSK